MDLGLDGKRFLVTGGTRGIGRAVTEGLLAEGAAVAFCARTADAVEVAQSELSTAGTALGTAVDVADAAAVATLITEVEGAFGGIDILVNNAGLTRDNILLRLKDDDWDAVLDANLRGAFLTIRGATRGMMKRRWGRIINISSVVGLTGNKGQSNYAASKAGLFGLTKSVAKELASRNILCNAIAPGFIETDMTAALSDEVRSGLTAQIPLERLGTPADVAAMVAFLASDHAAYITGQVFVVDGGMVM
jgi:3-oxoacyl-[acyl-carrier protein] reductase